MIDFNFMVEQFSSQVLIQVGCQRAIEPVPERTLGKTIDQIVHILVVVLDEVLIFPLRQRQVAFHPLAMHQKKQKQDQTDHHQRFVPPDFSFGGIIRQIFLILIVLNY